MPDSNAHITDITVYEFVNLLAHLRALTLLTQEMLFYQSCYLKRKDKQTLAKAKKLEMATRKMVGYCLSLEKVFNIDTKARTNALLDLSMSPSL